MAAPSPLSLLLLCSLLQLTASFCPLACQCNEEVLSVSCAASQLEVLPITLNPGIQRLQLQRNNIRAVDAALGFYAQLQYVDLSHNQLISLPDRGFIQQKKLVELRLTNNKIFKVSPATFTGLKTVTILSLRKNFLEQLGSAVFSDLTHVEELDLGQNRIRTVHAEAFAGLKHLRVLYLDDNDLGEVPSPAFSPLPHLAELSLALNNIQAVPARAFSPITNLYSLDLHDCRISNLSLAAFQGLESLRILRLSGNLLSFLPSLQLTGLERLEELSLGGNYIEVLPARGFLGLRKLRALDLSSSPRLTRVQEGAFQDLSSLSWLSLSSCPSLSLQPGSLLPLTHLTALHLNSLGWTSVSRDLVQWQSLSSLDLSNNPLHCDCTLAWLHQVLSASGNTSSAECSSPPSLAGKSVKDLPPSVLRCSSSTGSGRQGILAVLCVLSGLATALLIVGAVHCQRRLCQGWSHCSSSHASQQFCQPEEDIGCCQTSRCEKYPVGSLSSPVTGGPMEQGLEAGLHYTHTHNNQVTQDVMYSGGIPPSSLYYPSNPSSTKSTYCEDDYFLTLSNDRRTFKSIRVAEI